MTTKIDQEIESFCTNTLKALSSLYENKLYGQMLVIMYSFIDSAGLLDAPPTQSKASGESFKNWAKKYLVTHPQINFNEVDLWSARCAVLHTFTSQSDLSNTGKAKELHYITGPSDSDAALAFNKQIIAMGQIPVHFESFYSALLHSMAKFSLDLAKNCENDNAYEARLNKILQQYLITS